MQQDVLNFMGAAKNNALMCATKAGERHDLAKKKLWVQNKGGHKSSDTSNSRTTKNVTETRHLEKLCSIYYVKTFALV